VKTSKTKFLFLKNYLESSISNCNLNPLNITQNIFHQNVRDKLKLKMQASVTQQYKLAVIHYWFAIRFYLHHTWRSIVHDFLATCGLTSAFSILLLAAFHWWMPCGRHIILLRHMQLELESILVLLLNHIWSTVDWESCSMKQTTWTTLTTRTRYKARFRSLPEPTR